MQFLTGTYARFNRQLVLEQERCITLERTVEQLAKELRSLEIQLKYHIPMVVEDKNMNQIQSEARIRKARSAFANLRHLWRRRVIRQSIKRRVYCVAVRSVLIYGSEIWPLRVEYTHKLLVFDHRCFRNIARICWDHRANNSDVRRKALRSDGKSVDEVVNHHRLRWLGHLSRMPEHRLP
ncbi:unnamed protein product [Schistosoma mattheei]|uniref:Uncharacterized protein n=1 Tax=Schistosoma mattheei TaxID=31246 RepID=A0A3P8GJA0_9TREM|nr:unnamed protein product [Schistosoma mattheei]